MNTDDLIAQMKEDELADRVAGTGSAKPIDYAKMRSLSPQQVYYRIRTNQLEVRVCECGNKIVDVAEADKVFGFTPKPDIKETRDG